MIVFHNVPHELALYKSELSLFGEIFDAPESLPTHIWIESDWDKDILESIMGVKKVYPKRFENKQLSVLTGRKWTELLGTKWEKQPSDYEREEEEIPS
jgi:hypothetical protein